MLAVGVWVALASVAWGEPGAPPPVRGDGTVVPPPVEARRIEPTRTSDGDRPSLFEAIHLRLPSWRSLGGSRDFLAQVSFEYTPTIPGSVVIEYEGLQGYVVHEIENRLSRQWSKDVRALDRWDGPYGPTLRERFQAMHDLRKDHERGRWWDRTWWQSAPASKGGAPDDPFVQQIGQRVEILALGPLSFTNDLRAQVADIALFQLDPGFVYRDLDREEPVKARDYARLDRSGGLLEDDEARDDEVPGRVQPRPGRPSLVIGSDSEALAFTFTPRVDGRILDGYRWRLRLKPRGRLALAGMQPAGGVSLKAVMQLEMGTGRARTRVAEIEMQVDYDPFEGEFEAELEFALLTW